MFLFLLIPAVLFLAGCGYQMKSRLDYTTPVAGKKIAVPIFANKSYRANLGAIVAGSLAEEFAKRSGGNVVNEDAADLVLSGAVLTYDYRPVSYSAADRVREYRATMTVEAVLTEKITRKVVWKGAVSWSQDYPVNFKVPAPPVPLVPPVLPVPPVPLVPLLPPAPPQTDVALLQNSESAAIREICNNLAQQIYEMVATGF